MEKTVKIRFDKHTVILSNAKTGEPLKTFVQDRKPTESKVVGDLIRERKAAKLPYVPVAFESSVTTETREMPLSFFVANSKIVENEPETESK